jgi:hypothetical protein
LNLTLSDSAVGSQYITGVEQLIGSGYGDTLSGNSSGNTLSGGGGNDTIDGNGGSDAIYAGGGNDIIRFDASDSVINGGAGTDSAILDNPGTGVSINTNLFSGIEQVTLGNANDTISITTGGYNISSINGGAGIDTINAAGAATGQTIGSTTGIENIYGSSYSDNITGDSSNNTLTGGGGNDTLNGGLGADSITGGAGNDTINGGGGSDSAIFSGNFSDIIADMKSGSGSGNINLGGTSASVTTDSTGTDTLNSVETLQFVDQSITVSSNYGPYARDDFLPDRVLGTPPGSSAMGMIPLSDILSNDFDINQGDQISSLTVVSMSNLFNWSIYNGHLQFNANTTEVPLEASITYQAIDNQGMAGDLGTVTFTYTAPDPGDTSVSGYPPLIMDLDGDGVELVNPKNSTVLFDIDTDGTKEAMLGWAGADDGILAFDHNNDGIIDRGDEIVLAGYHPDAKTDLEGLALAFDSNHDGVFDAADEAWSQFGIWQDISQNGQCEAGEWRTLEDAEIESIGLTTDDTAYKTGNAEVYGTGHYMTTEGTTLEFTDTTLGYDELPANATNSSAIDAETGILELGESDMIIEVMAAELDMTLVADVDPDFSEVTGGTELFAVLSEDENDEAQAEQTEEEEYQEFLFQYNAEMETITELLNESPVSEVDPAIHVLIAEEIAAVHQIYNQEVLIPESNLQTDSGMDAVLEPINELWEFDAIWQDQPDPDFVYG